MPVALEGGRIPHCRGKLRGVDQHLRWRMSETIVFPMYEAYQAQCDVLAPARATAKLMSALWSPFAASPFNLFARHAQAACDLVARSGLLHTRPAFGITSVQIGGVGAAAVDVSEENVVVTPFATLIHFRKATANKGPIVLVVAALSGHFATLTRGTVQTLLRDHDVYITDWHSARDMPVSAGKFGLDEYTDHVIAFLDRLGPETNVVAICQSGPPVLAAVSIMAQRESPNQPRTMTLMASPIDPRRSPNKINKLAESKQIDFFEQFIQQVPARYGGAGRNVYPGFFQVSAFAMMNVGNHVNKHIELYNALVANDDAKAGAITDFYDEYLSVLDSTEEFYLETIQRVFLDCDLARGRAYHHGVLVTPAAIEQTKLLVVEGEKDDMCGIGQTAAALDLCTGLAESHKRYHLQPNVGHYGVFHGSRWNSGTYPIVREFIAQANILESTDREFVSGLAA